LSNNFKVFLMGNLLESSKDSPPASIAGGELDKKL
jgi:hypothetical protein